MSRSSQPRVPTSKFRSPIPMRKHILCAFLVAMSIFHGGISFGGSPPSSLAIPVMPQTHRQMLQTLSATKQVNFQSITPEQFLADVAEAIDIDVRFHESMATHLPKGRLIKFETSVPVSYRTMIRIALQNQGVHNAGIVFAENEIIIVPPSYEGVALRTVDLRGRSDLSIRKRRELIQAAIANTDAKAWDGNQRTWIGEGESVFEIDTYQSFEVYHEIDSALNTHGQYPVLNLFGFGNEQFSLLQKNDAERKAKAEKIVADLREKYAYRSIASRLQYESKTAEKESPVLSERAKKYIVQEDGEFAARAKSKYDWESLRAKSLRALHQDEVSAFISRAGNGFMRMPSPSPSMLPRPPAQDYPMAATGRLPSNEAVPMKIPATTTEASTRQVQLPSEQAIYAYHTASRKAFLSPASFGDIKDREHVAGFDPHAFAFVPRIDSHMRKPWYDKAKELWAIQRLELVSLLKHEKPAVYVSKNLPRMDKLVEAETRRLNKFEDNGLKQLQAGEDIVTTASLNRIELMGSLRASKQCLQCHDVPHGSLLGAFSYELHRDPPIDVKKYKQQESRPVL